MTGFRNIFIDTGAFLAMADPQDSFREAAVSFYRQLPAATTRISSWAVIAESYTWLRYHLDGLKARTWLQRIDEAQDTGILRLCYPDPNLDQRARRILQRMTDQTLSYTDALSIGICQAQTDVDAVFAFDHRMALTGLPVFPGQVKRED